MFRTKCARMMWVGLLALPGWALADPIVPSSPTTLWTQVDYPTLPPPDAAGDHGTNRTETDVVGDAADASFYTIFDDAGTPLTTDGNIGFRVRVSGDSQGAGFNNFLMVGLDFGEDATGDIDLFLGVNGRGRRDNVAIFRPGATANVSPTTTSLLTPAAQRYPQDSDNYAFSSMNGTIDPGVLTTDFGSDGTDRFISFVVPFDAIVTEMFALNMTIDENSKVRYVVGTGTRPTLLDQDLSGTTAGWSDPRSWDELGTSSFVYLLRGTRAPEPGTATLVCIGLLLLSARRRAGGRR
ncbi:MAG: hypothetical protein JRH19_24865 [Deltaproteobacteria bacterium]|nr:hypothetical protein [Deltaproteobacteria bacterium]